MLKPAYRLAKEQDFKLLARKGRPASLDLFSAKVLPNNLAHSRFGIVISAKVSKKAVVRNLIKRRLAEVIRLNLNQIKPGYDVMILVKAVAVGKDYPQLEQALAGLFDKAKLLFPLKK